MRSVVVGLLFVLTACKKSAPAGTPVDAAAPPASASPIASASGAPATAVPKTCAIEPKGGIAIPATSKATEIRIASAGGKALVTWFEKTNPDDGPYQTFAYGSVFDGAGVGARLEIESNTVADEPVTGAVPLAVGNELVSVSCWYGAPMGHYKCSRRAAGDAKPTPFVSFTGISGGAPQEPAIGAVATANDTLVFVPDNGRPDVIVLSASVSGKKKTRNFLSVDGAKIPHPDGLGAVLASAGEAALVYRLQDAVVGRRAGFDETWRGKPITLSTPHKPGKQPLVGAPVIASRGDDVAVLFSERAKGTDPWHLVLVDWKGEPKAIPLATGAEQTQAPGIAAGETCFVASWVEGTGKTTRTKLAPLCDGKLDVARALALSTDGVEGGRAYLAKDAVVWQEIPAGKPAELRVAKLACP